MRPWMFATDITRFVEDDAERFAEIGRGEIGKRCAASCLRVNCTAGRLNWSSPGDALRSSLPDTTDTFLTA